MTRESGLSFLRRVRWGNVARLAAAIAALGLVIAWPRLRPREPALPPASVVPAVSGGRAEHAVRAEPRGGGRDRPWAKQRRPARSAKRGGRAKRRSAAEGRRRSAKRGGRAKWRSAAKRRPAAKRRRQAKRRRPAKRRRHAEPRRRAETLPGGNDRAPVARPPQGPAQRPAPRPAPTAPAPAEFVFG